MSESSIDLVTGGAGFIGTHLVRALVGRGRTVRVLDPEAERFVGMEGVEPIAASILEPDPVRAAMNGVDTLYHMASYAHLWAPKKSIFREINLRGAEIVFTLARQKGIRKAVLTSTETVLRGWRNKSADPIRESDPRPLFDIPGPYTDSKLLQEGIARIAFQEGLDLSVVYPTVPIGAGDENFTAPTKMVADLLAGRAPAYLETELNFVDLRDVVQGHLLAAEKGRAGEGYILGGENLQLSDFLKLLEEVSGQAMPSRRISFPLAYIGAMAVQMASRLTRKPPVATVEGVRIARHSNAVDLTKSRSELGYDPRPIRPALERLVAWLNARETGNPA